MKRTLEYKSPSCRLMDVCTEGVLCVSQFGDVENIPTDPAGNEGFGNLKEFEW